MNIYDSGGNRVDGWILDYAGSVFAMVLDGDDNAFLTTGNYEVRKYSAGGALTVTFGAYGANDEQFAFPVGIALDSDGFVYVADRMLSRVQKFNAAGTFQLKWGSAGSEPGQFFYPGCLAVDNQGSILVADRPSTGPRIQVFTSDGTSVRQFTPPACDATVAPDIRAVAMDPAGTLYLVRYGSDAGVACVQQLDAEGNLVCSLGSCGTAEGQFQAVRDVCPDGSGLVFVLEEVAQRIHKFRMDLVPVEPATWGAIKAMYR